MAGPGRDVGGVAGGRGRGAVERVVETVEVVQAREEMGGRAVEAKEGWGMGRAVLVMMVAMVVAREG